MSAAFEMCANARESAEPKSAFSQSHFTPLLREKCDAWSTAAKIPSANDCKYACMLHSAELASNAQASLGKRVPFVLGFERLLAAAQNRYRPN